MRKKPFEIIHRISRAISRATKLEGIYPVILKEIASSLEVERASIMRYDPNSQSLKIVAALGLEPEIWKTVEIAVGEGLSGRAFKEGKPLLIKELKGNPRYKTHSFMIAPVTCFSMKVGQVPIGIINLTDKKSKQPFTEEDLKLVTTISDQVASYMHLYDLVDQLKSTEALRLELELARDIQQRLLPKTPPKIKGMDLAGCLIPAQRVGADYYDFFVSNSDTLSLCIADVSGHSVVGALLAFAFRSSLRTEIPRGKNPAEIIHTINKILFSDLLHSEQFISSFYAQIHLASQTLSFTNAGHPPGLLLKNGKEAQWLFSQDSLLGIDPDDSFHQKKIELSKGDLLVLYTDGLIEALNPKKERFGGTRLLTILQKHSIQSAHEGLSILMNSLEDFMGPFPLKDDVSLVVLKVT